MRTDPTPPTPGDHYVAPGRPWLRWRIKSRWTMRMPAPPHYILQEVRTGEEKTISESALIDPEMYRRVVGTTAPDDGRATG